MRFASISRRTSSPAPAPSIRRRGPEQARIEYAVEPAPDEDADQHRRDDDPAEHADLRETARHRRIASSRSQRRASLAAQPRRPCTRRIAGSSVASGHREVRRTAAPVRRRWLHDLADRVELQPRAVDTLRPFRFDIGAKARQDGLVERREIVAGHRLARRDGDVLPPVTVSTPRAHRAIMRRARRRLSS